MPSICAQDQISDWFDSLAECLHWNVRKGQKSLDDIDRVSDHMQNVRLTWWSAPNSAVSLSLSQYMPSELQTRTDQTISIVNIVNPPPFPPSRFHRYIICLSLHQASLFLHLQQTQKKRTQGHHTPNKHDTHTNNVFTCRSSFVLTRCKGFIHIFTYCIWNIYVTRGLASP